MSNLIVFIIKLSITKFFRILNFNFVSILNAGIKGLKQLIELQIMYKIVLKLINVINYLLDIL